MVEERTFATRLADVIMYTALGLAALLCVLPFFNVVAVSLSDALATRLNRVTLWPIGFNLDNYGYLMLDRVFRGSFNISVLRVTLGVALNLLVTVITAYPLSRDRIHMPGRSLFKGIMLFLMLFSPGLIPIFMTYKNLGLLNKFAVLVIPGSLNIFFVIVIMNFFRGIPSELWESAMLDGANHLDILFRIFVPISTPSLATVALFSAVGHWNAWFDGIVFMQRREQWPLQSYLYARVTTRAMAWETATRGAEAAAKAAMEFQNATPEGLAAAMIVIASVPIMLVYPFLQRYFVTGLTLGSVKG